MSECAWQFLSLVTQSHLTTHQIMQFIKHKLEFNFKSPSISAHFDILIITNTFLFLLCALEKRSQRIRTKVSKPQELLRVNDP